MIGKWTCLCAAVLLPLMAWTISGAANADVAKVKIVEMGFAPASVSIKAGDTVEWINGDFVDHSATATDHQWEVVIKAGQSERRTFAQPGTHKYFCRFHPDMAGTVTVAP